MTARSQRVVAVAFDRGDDSEIPSARPVPTVEITGPRFFAFTFAVALAFGLLGIALGFVSAYATARLDTYRLPPECSYVGGGVSMCLFPSNLTKTQKRETERAPPSAEIVRPPPPFVTLEHRGPPPRSRAYGE